MQRRFKEIAAKLIPAKESCPKCGGKLKQVVNGYHCKNNDWSLVIKDGKVKWYQKVLIFINGYKTLGGAIVWGVGSIVGLPWLAIIGEVITAGGGTHKVVKTVGKAKNKMREESIDWKTIVEMIISFLKKIVKAR